MEDRLWTARELAQFLCYSESTVTRMVSQAPHKLPPRVSGLAKPRWVPEVARQWAASNSAPRPRMGRRRL